MSEVFLSVFAALSLQNPLDTSVPGRILVSATVLCKAGHVSLCSHDALNRSVFYTYSPPHYLPLYPDRDPRQPLRLQSLWSSNHRSKQSQLHSSGHNAFMSFIYSSPFWGHRIKPLPGDLQVLLLIFRPIPTQKSFDFQTTDFAVDFLKSIWELKNPRIWLFIPLRLLLHFFQWAIFLTFSN